MAYTEVKNLRNLQKISRNHMKMQISVIFLMKNWGINMLKIKHVIKLGITVIIQVEMLHIAYII